MKKLLANEIHYIFDLGVLCMYICMSMDLQNCLYLKILISWKQSLKIYLELSSKNIYLLASLRYKGERLHMKYSCIS